MPSRKEFEAVLLWLLKDKILDYRNKCLETRVPQICMEYRLDTTETKIAKAINVEMLFGVKLIWSKD